MTADLDAGALKACCAAGYSSDLVSLLLGDSYHPGGLSLSRQLFDRVGLTAGQRLVDVAAGRGTTPCSRSASTARGSTASISRRPMSRSPPARRPPHTSRTAPSSTWVTPKPFRSRTVVRTS